MDLSADVIISGAGPAGSSAAFDLSKAGFRVVLFEKSTFPRYKVCGAGLTHKILAELPYDVSPIIENTVFSVRFSHYFRDIFTRHSEVPLIYCTQRHLLDDFMLNQAVSAGTLAHMEEPVKEVSQTRDYVQVVTPVGTYRSRLLIGADGASGPVARLAGLRRNIGKGLAWEAELDADREDLGRYHSTVFLDWGTFPGGYGWVFPKKGHFSVGVGGPAILAGKMMPYYHRFLQSTGIRFGETLSLKSWPIPVRLRTGDFHSGRIMVAGDAGGLTDPLTGEGIWYAVRSGRMAAEQAVGFLKGESGGLAGYSGLVNRTLMQDIIGANRIRDVFNAAPGRIHRLVSENERVWRAFGKILRGERCYSDVRGGFGKYAFLWGTVCRLSAVIYKIKAWKAKRKF